jgi:uncharacterized protein DUF4395
MAFPKSRARSPSASPSPVVTNFMRQQGFAEEPADACNMRFEGLYFQPSIVFPLVLVAVALQSAVLFLLISAALWWSVLFPAWNPFELAYNRWIAAPRGRLPLSPAPSPRRFAQAVNAAFNLASGLTLLAGQREASWVIQAMLVAAFSLLVFGKFCLGAYVFHLLRGEVAFANRTLPWARD